jgi:hypothetical protein
MSRVTGIMVIFFVIGAGFLFVFVLMAG